MIKKTGSNCKYIFDIITKLAAKIGIYSENAPLFIISDNYNR
jgi:hypothetical protein